MTQRANFTGGIALAYCLLVPTLVATAQQREPNEEGFGEVTCRGDFQHHLQGVCIDDKSAIYWSFTTQLVKTDRSGQILEQRAVSNHHGDLCFANGRVYVAVNLGKFNDPEGNADSWVYVYDPKTLKLLHRHQTQQVFHGAGGIGTRGGRFYVVGGLPTGIQDNYIYEYDEQFQFVKKHIVPSGWTQLGIQTATFHQGSWWLGCYGTPKILLRTDKDFKLIGRYEFDCSLGIVGISNERMLFASGPRTADGRCLGKLHPARPDADRGLQPIVR